MIQKVKELFAFIGRAWTGGVRGKIGIIAFLFAVLFIARMFIGHATIPGLITGEFHLARERAQLQTERERLTAVETHIQLVQSHSHDFIEELAQSRLNIGNPNLRILR
ncbi:MAG: hypothetical protein FWC83_02285 [Alphaproteobacteria bacterium]|nr:hypothetical protein [Alphaproteobacteria bacterium]